MSISVSSAGSSPAYLRKPKLFCSCLFFALLSGCSGSIFGSSATPEARSTLTKISNNYLTNIVVGNEKQFADMVNWTSLLGSISPAEFQRQWDGCLKQFGGLKNSAAEHPFLALEVTSISVSENDAEVNLRKSAQAGPSTGPTPKVWIKYLWQGTGWIAQEDSIFGAGKFCSKYATPAK